MNIFKQTVEVYCTLQIEATHCWATCPYEEVAYLRDPHRHIFHIKAYKMVTHEDRDIEFIMLKHRIQEYFKQSPVDSKTGILSLGGMSCEMIAGNLCNHFDLSRCEVSEDGENGAIITREYVE